MNANPPPSGADPVDADEPAGSHAEGLDANDVACLAAGAPTRAERERLLSALVGRPGSASLAAALAEEAARLASSPRPEAAPAAGQRRLAWVAAAALLLGLGGWLLRGSGLPQARPLGDADVLAAFARLETRDPVLFTGLALRLQDLASTDIPDVERSGLSVCEPRGALTTGRPTTRWEDAWSEGPWEVTVVTEDAEVLFRISSEGPQLLWPATAPSLEAGQRAVVTVESLADGPRRRGGASFRHLDPAEGARYERALELVAREDLGPLAPVVRAHLALRFGLWHAASAELNARVTPEIEALADGARKAAAARLPCDRLR